MKNGIEKYIVIDCRHSKIEWIKNNIMNSSLNGIFALNNIDWVKINKNSLSSFVTLSRKLKNGGKNSIEIAKTLKLNKSTVRKYLKQRKLN